MKLGVIARADDRGLGNQTWEVVRNMAPERVLVIRDPASEATGFPVHLDRFPGATVLTWERPNYLLPEREVREWLDGLDVIYSAETLYDWRIADWARDQGCSTVVHLNPEFYAHHLEDRAEPDVWWSATDWRKDHLPARVRVVPMPVPIDRWPDVDLSAAPRRVLHVAGWAGTHNRNNTRRVVEAARYVGDVEIVMVAQDQPNRRNQKISHRAASVNYWEMYADASAIVLPRRYGGLCLPANEACGAGLVPIMPDVEPNRWWPIEPMQARPARQPMITVAGELATWDVDPPQVARAIRNLFDGDVAARRREARLWAEEHSWDRLAAMWRGELEMACEGVRC